MAKIDSMLAENELLLRDAGAELVFGLVGPVGANLDRFERDLCDQLGEYGYRSETIRLSAFLRSIKPKSLGFDLVESPEYKRITSYMDAGNKVRNESGANEILALWAIASIATSRGGRRKERTAYVLRSIKHPAEARALRAVYGPGFFLIGIAAFEDQQIVNLQKDDKRLTLEEANDVLERDKREEDGSGQHMRDAFELVDVFIRQEAGDERRNHALERFLRLVFGDVVETPTADEHAMFLAFATSLRSADLSRQVGAVIWRDAVGVVATGRNDVPASGGGLYPTMDGEDQRDYILGHDPNERHKREIISEIVKRTLELLDKPNDRELQSQLTEGFQNTRLLDITEFGRAVHAEMDALLGCVRAGVSTHDCTLYSTTFPCHNCAKHIIAAGIRRVVFVEPYPKSQAFDLHGDAIRRGDIDVPRNHDASASKKVVFEPFVGVGPRRYFDLFSMKLSNGYNLKRKENGEKASWKKSGAFARVPMLLTSYLERETELASRMAQLLNRGGLE